MDHYSSYDLGPGYYGSSTTDLTTPLTSVVPRNDSVSPNLPSNENETYHSTPPVLTPTSSSSSASRHNYEQSHRNNAYGHGISTPSSNSPPNHTSDEPRREIPQVAPIQIGQDDTAQLGGQYRASMSTIRPTIGNFENRHSAASYPSSPLDLDFYPPTTVDLPNLPPPPSPQSTRQSNFGTNLAPARGMTESPSPKLRNVRIATAYDPAPPVPSAIPEPTFLGVNQEDVVRKPSMARRMLEKGSRGLQRMKTGKKKSQDLGDGNYNKIEDPEEDEEGYGYDLTTFDNDFFQHMKAESSSYDEIRRQAMRTVTMDLSDDHYTLTSKNTGLYNELQIPVDPDPPNWKPWEIRLPYLLFLNILTLTLIGVTEYLIRLSDYIGPKGLLQYYDPTKVPISAWIAWKYLPTMVGVVYGVFWELTDTEVKRVEPYYQMSRPQGALAGNSLNVEYFTFWAFLAPLQALKYTQWAVLTSSVAYVMSYAFIPNLLSAIINIDNESLDALDHIENQKTLSIDNNYARGLQACLGVVLVAGVFLMWELGRRKSGLVGDVSGIAGIAAMANKSHVLMDFKDLDEASEKKIHMHLSRRRYRLYKMSLYLGDAVSKEERQQFQEPRFMRFLRRKKPRKPQATILTLWAGVPFLVFLFGVLAVMPVLAFEPKKAHPVLTSIPFLATALGIIIKSVWTVLDKDLRTLEPFWRLHKGHAPPNILTLDYTGTIPGMVTIKALKNKHWLLALVTWNSVLIEVFTVTMGSFLNRSAAQEETTLSIEISYLLSTIICVSLICTAIIVYYFRRDPFLPRQPGTISSVLTFIHQSKMITDFESMEFWSTKKREQKLMEIGKTYAFGWFVGRDRKVHLGIDQEEIKGKYKWGVDFKAGVLEGYVGDYDRYEA